MKKFQPKSVNVVLEGGIAAPAGVVFPLCCPVEEYRWIEGWKCRLVHCPHDRVERGCVFDEIFSAPFLLGRSRGFTRWTAVVHEPESHTLHFTLENEISSTLYKIELGDDGRGGTRVVLDFTYTARNRAGNRVIQNRGRQKILFMLSMISAMLKHYSETGKMLKTPAMVNMIIREKALSWPDYGRLAGNKVFMTLLRDPDRRRLLPAFRRQP